MARPAGGAGHYLRDLVGGGNDGVITTMAVVSSAAGAGLSARVAIIMGLANLVADGLSMGSSGYLALKSELHQTGGSVDEERPARHGIATMVAFVLAGAVPLLAFAPGLGRGPTLLAASALGALTLAAIGAARARYIDRPAWRCSAEMLVVGGSAAGVAYVVGVAVESLLAQ